MFRTFGDLGLRSLRLYIEDISLRNQTANGDYILYEAWMEEITILKSNDPGYMIKMAAMPIYGINLTNVIP